MKKAIVTGANGYVGTAVIRKLLEHGIEVLAISRQGNPSLLPQNESNNNVKYINLDLKKINILPDLIKELSWDVGDDCVFYNFAWEGSSQLMDGTLEDQMKNVTYSSNAVIVASKVGCVKFIASGSIEETFAEHFIKNSWKVDPYYSQNGFYALAKIAARNMCKLVAYLHKIDYVHTRFSAVIDNQLSGKGYIAKVIRNILSDLPYEKPNNNQLFDIINLEDLALAYYKIGLYGNNKKDYFIGSGNPRSLNDYFSGLLTWKNSGVLEFFGEPVKDPLFNNELLKNEIGLDLSQSFPQVLKKIK